ncbi:protein S-acyltransferase [Malassezia sp. CBS 17886]|nr:protein S-acyltransferase [Malassezia sp. CBS 17886]
MSLPTSLKALLYAPTYAGRPSAYEAGRMVAAGRSGMPRPAPRAALLDDLFRRVSDSAAERRVAWAEWLSVCTATLFALDSPGSLRVVHRFAMRADEGSGVRPLEERVDRACLMREVGLKCIGLIGTPKAINNLSTLRSVVDEDAELARAMPTDPRRDLSTPEWNQAKAAGNKVFDSIYLDKAEKLRQVLSKSHPDLAHYIVSHEYGALFAPPPMYTADGADAAPLPWEGTRQRMSLISIAALQAQGGVAPQVTSHVYGLLRSGPSIEHVSDPAREGLDFLTTPDGATWVVETVNEICRVVDGAEEQDREPGGRGGGGAPGKSGAATESGVKTARIAEPAVPARNEPPATIHTCAQRGDVDALRGLLQSHAATARDTDAEGITPLHWAAINAHADCCAVLLEHGADMHAMSGDLQATALQWAARNGHVHVMQFLLESGADPLFMDRQGFNMLHLVTHSSQVMPLVYALQLPVFAPGAALDYKDPQGHTALMWAAFQGDAISVDLLLKHGADVHTKDEAGLTPLHWAVVRGNQLCVRRVMAAGADLDAKTHEGKSPQELSKEMHSFTAYEGALRELHRDERGKPSPPRIPRSLQDTLLLLLLTGALGIVTAALGRLPWYWGIPAAAVTFISTNVFIFRLLIDARQADAVRRSRYFLAVVLASLVWVAVHWVHSVAPGTPDRVVHNTMIAVMLVCVGGCIAYCASKPPGVCQQPASPDDRRREVVELVHKGQLNAMTYCAHCLARRPLRSRHCQVLVGLENHRMFIVSVFTAFAGMSTYVGLVYHYYVQNVPPHPLGHRGGSIPAFVRGALAYNGMVFAHAAWLVILEAWLLLLGCVQLAQASRQLTTFEASNVGRYGFMGGRGEMNLATQRGYMHQQTERLQAAGLSSEEIQAQLHGKRLHPQRTLCGVLASCGSSLMSVAGLDLYTRGKGGRGLRASSRGSNPFDAGFFANWRDFWTKGGHLRVDYTCLYEVPAEGFAGTRASPPTRT